MNILIGSSIILIMIGIGAVIYSIYKTPDDNLNSDEERAIKDYVSKHLES